MTTFHSCRRRIVSVLAVVAASLCLPAQASGFGEGVVRLVVPFSPAGATDFVARAIAPLLAEEFGTQVIVVNTPGAAGTIGASSVANAAPDGNTLLLYHIAMVTTRHVQKSLPYDPLKAFTPIGLVGEASNVISVNPDFPAKTLGELIDYAKANPERVHFGSSGVGGSDHLGGELLQMATGIKLTHVPYKGGGPATAAVVAGEIQMNAGTVAQVAPMIRAGRLRPLAVMQKERTASLPDTPSTAEVGYPALDHKTWFGLWGPANMQPDLVNRINAALSKVLARDDVQKAMSSVGIDPRSTSPKEFDSYVREQDARWDKVLAGKFQ